MRRFTSFVLAAMMLLGGASVAHGAFEPRTSACMAPELMTSVPGKLPSAMIPSAYTKGTLLAVNEEWRAYQNIWEPSQLTVERLTGRDDDYSEWMSDDLAAIILDGGTVICLEGGGYGGDCLLEIYEDEEIIFTYEFEPVSDEEGEGASYRYACGPMLLLEDGTLLILDAYGMLYACHKDGTGMRKVTDTAMDDFVYYDGMIYFANLDDAATYDDVYYDADEEYYDLTYPKLYRMNLDGSGKEKLTDGGVCGLASQGQYILYQNIDEPFTFAIDESGGPGMLSGPLNRYDAQTGQHRSLGIESNDYIATPYGLAVWYNEFRIEPYDVERADLILHDYDGNPLYRLDAGPLELLGAWGRNGTNLEFYGYNWFLQILWFQGLMDDEEYMDEEEFVFTTVPLDGSERIGGIKEIPAYMVDYYNYDDEDWYDDDWGDEEDWDDEDDWHDDEWDDESQWYGDVDADEINVYPGLFKDGWMAIDATPNQRMATRTGPGTKYTEEHGTLPEDTEIVVYAQDSTGSTPWALIEFVKNGKLVRTYTGMKRIDTDSDDIPVLTKEPKFATVTEDVTAYYGPGTAYMAVEGKIAPGTQVLVYGEDRGYAFVEFAVEGDMWVRVWVAEASLLLR